MDKIANNKLEIFVFGQDFLAKQGRRGTQMGAGCPEEVARAHQFPLYGGHPEQF